MAGSKVYSYDGRLLNIEDIHISDGIASYNEQQ
nr:MAG TPA: ataxin-1 binding protein [Caudoviricetes sp.]